MHSTLSSPSMDVLPLDVLHLIFSQFTQPTELSPLVRVCKFWRRNVMKHIFGDLRSKSWGPTWSSLWSIWFNICEGNIRKFPQDRFYWRDCFSATIELKGDKKGREILEKNLIYAKLIELILKRASKQGHRCGGSGRKRRSMWHRDCDGFMAYIRPILSAIPAYL